MRPRGFRRERRPARGAAPASGGADRPTRWACGPRAALEALRRRPADVREIWIEHERRGPEIGPLIREARERGVPVQFMSRPELDRASAGGRHEGVAARVAFDPEGTFAEWVEGLSEERKKGLLVVALDQVQDPHNLGAIARSALQLGAAALLAPERRSAPVTQASIQASAGAILRLPVHRVVNLAQALALSRKAGFWIYGADAGGRDAWSAQLRFPAVLVIGSEGYGMRPLVRASCDELLRVPQIEHGVGSLNASCAATALLYEAARQRAAGAP